MKYRFKRNFFKFTLGFIGLLVLGFAGLVLSGGAYDEAQQAQTEAAPAENVDDAAGRENAQEKGE